MSKILLVEDNKLSQKMMFYTLRNMGLKADYAEDGQEAADMASAVDYDLILMDVMMPVLDGYSSTRLIREAEQKSGRHTFIIGLTSNVYDQERQKCIEAGMDEYMPKPFEVEVFKNIVSSAGIIHFDR